MHLVMCVWPGHDNAGPVLPRVLFVSHGSQGPPDRTGRSRLAHAVASHRTADARDAAAIRPGEVLPVRLRWPCHIRVTEQP